MIHAVNLSYTYPFQKQPALRGVSFELERGAAMLITGPSGCGKSTLLRIINGLIPNHYKGGLEGNLTVATLKMPVDMQQLSRYVGTILQHPDDQFMATTVEDEVALALEWQQLPAAAISERVDNALQALKLERLRNRSVFTLSQGEKQKCVLAAILALEPDVIVMDEPTANLSPEATDELREICLELKKRRITLVIVDHRLYWLHGVLDQVLVLNDGQTVFQAQKTDGEPLELLQKHQAAEKWGLRALAITRRQLPEVSAPDNPAVEVSNLTFRYPRTNSDIFSDFAAAVPGAAVTALVGANGAGKTTLARLLCGLEKPRHGKIRHCGKAFSAKNLRRSTAFVMQQMEVQLYMRSVLEELLYSAPRSAPAAQRRQAADHWLQVFRLQELALRHPHSLSGGEKQRLVIACALIKQPQLLILDEPTSGLDGANMRIIAEQIIAFAAKGGAVLLITHDLELLALAAEYQITLDGKAEPSVPDGSSATRFFSKGRNDRLVTDYVRENRENRWNQ